MKRDIHKLSAWLEQTVQAGIADEQKLVEWKLTQKKSGKDIEPATTSRATAS
jgi:hypothetical protein